MDSCPYCGSNVDLVNGNGFYCDFCDLLGERPSKNGERQQRKELSFKITLEDANKSTPELMTYHVYDLLQLLKLLRDDRRQSFNHVKIFEGDLPEGLKDIEIMTGRDYEWKTRKTWIVENIVRERIGYIPKSISDQLLKQWLNRMDHDKERGPMTFSNKTINSR